MGFFGDILDVVKDVGGALSGFGGLATGVGNFVGAQQQQNSSQEMAREQMAFNSAEAEKSRDWQYSMMQNNYNFQQAMSNTAYQRATADMRKAGLNPILAYRQGGASSPVGGTSGGATASGAMGTAQNIMGAAANAGVSTAMAAKRLEADLENIDADTRKKESERVLNSELTGKAGDEARFMRERARNEEVVRTRLENENQTSAADASRSKIVEEFMNSDLGKWITKFGIGGKELNPLLGAGNSAKSFIGR